MAEHEVTKIVAVVAGIAEKLGVETEADREVHELNKDVAPEAVLDEIESGSA